MKYAQHNTRNIVGTALATVASGCILATPVGAVPIAQIDNQATGTYETLTGEQRSIHILSNSVSIVLQEIAGVAITPSGITRSDGSLNGGAVSGADFGNLLYFNFNINNIGNDTTRFFLPNVARISGLGVFKQIQYFDGVAWRDVGNDGYLSEAINVNDKLLVRVVVQVTGSNGNISVTLGNTANPDQTQNQTRLDNPEDVFTVDAADKSTNEVAGNPTNGVREAQSSQSIGVGLASEALAQVNLAVSQPYSLTDNTIGFGLSLVVLNVLPPNFSNIQTSDLTGTDISINGQTKNGVLISNAIPLGTKFVAATVPSSDWTPIYFYSSTPIGVNDRADQAAWSTTPPDDTTASNVKRVGFFRGDVRIAKGTEINGFQLKVAVTDSTQSQIYNIAQVFGSNPADPYSSANKNSGQILIFDESGDSLPNNYNNDGTPALKDSNQQPLINPGIVDPNTPENDPRSPVKVGEALGSNSIFSTAGEFIKIVLKVVTPPSLKNGPREQPQAIGPNDDNDDFTNKSTALANVTATTFDPTPLSFTNTVINTSAQAQDIKILPRVVLSTAIPTGTQVSLVDPANPTVTASFEYKNGVFIAKVGSPAALVLKQVSANSTKNYTVTIDLPPDTTIVKDYPVQILAFIDTNNNNQADTNEAQNITIDRVYTGFMKVVKESRVLGIDRRPLNNGQGDGAFSETIKPVSIDQFIEYRITYTNISTPETATARGNKTISANNFVIIEDGQIQPNNWAQLTDHDPSSATSSAGNIVYSTGTTATDTTNPLVIRYENRLTSAIAPGQSGTFTFRRRVK